MSVKIVLIGFLVFILVSTTLTIHQGLLTIKSVKVVADKITCTTPDQLRESSKLLGQNIILINSSKISNEIKSKFLCVKDVEIIRHFPNKVSVSVSSREPKALLLTLSSNEATQSASLENIATPSARAIVKEADRFLIDSDGVVYSKDGNSLDIPQIYYYKGDVSLGQSVRAISDSLEILRKVRSFGLDAKESEILDEFLLIYTKPKVIFKLDENIEVQLASLQLILNKAKIEENILEFIDLRFDKPVIKLAPKKNGKR